MKVKSNNIEVSDFVSIKLTVSYKLCMAKDVKKLLLKLKRQGNTKRRI